MALFNRYFRLFLFSVGIHLCSPATAEGLFDWQRSNIQFSRGYTFELGPDQRSILTFEHADGYRYGDNYLFYDYTTTTESYYAEWRTRLSLSKLSGRKVSFGAVEDLLIAAQFEFPDGLDNRESIGLGIAWNIPGFERVGTNVMSRDDPRFSGRAALVVLNWATKMNWGAPVHFEGFCDFQGSEGNRGGWVLCQPRLLLDAGYFSGTEGKFFVGAEYQYWSDKFGAGITNEHVIQGQLKFVF